jgi:hypothetical protein
MGEIIMDFKYYLPFNHSISQSIKNFEYTNDEDKWGIVIDKDTINNFFKKKNLPLIETYISISEIAEYNFYDILNTAILNNNHVIFGYDYNLLFKNIKSKIGHVSLISRVISDSIIEIYNPGPENWGLKQFKLDDLYYAIKAKNDGLWIISKLK